MSSVKRLVTKNHAHRIIVSAEWQDSLSESMDSIDTDSFDEHITENTTNSKELNLTGRPTPKKLAQIKNYLIERLTTAGRNRHSQWNEIKQYLRLHRKIVTFHLSTELLKKIFKTKKLIFLRRLMRDRRLRFYYPPDVPRSLFDNSYQYNLFWNLPWRANALRPRNRQQVLRGLGYLLFKESIMKYPQLIKSLLKKPMTNYDLVFKWATESGLCSVVEDFRIHNITKN